MSGMVEVEGLVKDFGGVTAVAGVSFTIRLIFNAVALLAARRAVRRALA